jgi:hypothetical protein
VETPFEKLEPEAREDWRESPVTQAFLASLHRERTRAVDVVVETIKGGHPDAIRMARLGGDLERLDTIIRVLVK